MNPMNDPTYLEFVRKMQNADISLRNPLSPAALTWSDDIAISLAQKYPFKHVGTSKIASVAIAQEFFQFYLLGNLHEKTYVSDVILRAMSLAMVSDGHQFLGLWANTANQVSWYQGSECYNTEWPDWGQAEIVGNIASKESIKAFGVYIEDLSAKILSQNQSDELYTLRVIVSYLATMALRALCKDEAYLQRAYCKTGIQKYISKTAGTRVDVIIPAPCNLFIELIKLHLKKGSLDMQVAVSHLLVTLFPEAGVNVSPTMASSKISSFVYVTALKHLENNGLQVAHFSLQAAHLLGVKWSDLASALHCSAFSCSLKTVTSALDKYSSAENPMLFWRWSRVIEDGYLIELAASFHEHLITVLAYIIYFKAPEEHRGILQARAVRSMSPTERIRLEVFAKTIVDFKFSQSSITRDPALNAKYLAPVQQQHQGADAKEKDEEKEHKGSTNEEYPKSWEKPSNLRQAPSSL